MDATRRRSLYKLGAIIALGYGSIAALITQFGSAYTGHIVFITVAVFFLGAMIVFRSKE